MRADIRAPTLFPRKDVMDMAAKDHINKNGMISFGSVFYVLKVQFLQYIISERSDDRGVQVIAVIWFPRYIASDARFVRPFLCHRVWEIGASGVRGQTTEDLLASTCGAN
jgi:hypothetical protein